MKLALSRVIESVITGDIQAVADWDVTVKTQAMVKTWSRTSLRSINPDSFFFNSFLPTSFPPSLSSFLGEDTYNSLTWGSSIHLAPQDDFSQIGQKAERVKNG